MIEMTCITCPNGCTLYVEKKDGIMKVSGNLCKRGETFAEGELNNPVRTISSTVRTIWQKVPVIPVRVSADIPKGRIFDVMKEINKMLIQKPVRCGEVIISDVLGLGVDIIVTSNVLFEWMKGENKNEH